VTGDPSIGAPAVLELDGVTRRFGRLPVIENLTLRIEAGAAVALLGPNGAGKTTLLRLSTTLLRPSAGRIRVLGLDPERDGLAIRRRVGLLSHDSFLYADLSPLENLLFYARLYGLPDAAARTDELIAELDLHASRHRPLRVLSRGTAQRCALARALLHRPDLLFLDEPFTGLDIESSRALIRLLRAEHGRGTTLVMTTHALDQAFSLCARAVVLSRGRLVWNDTLAGHTPASFESVYTGLTGYQAPRAAQLPC